MKIIVFIVTVLILLAASTVGFFLLLLGLNGFSGDEATPSLIFHIVLGCLSALGLGIAGAFTAKRLVEKKSLGKISASAIAIFSFSILGGVILVIGFFVEVMLATLMHEWR